MIVVWQDFRGADPDIYAQHITAAGVYVYSIDGIVVSNSPETQQLPSIAMVGPQGAIAVFEDFQNWLVSGDDIYAQYIVGRSNWKGTTTVPGWDAPAVPRNQMGATTNSCAVTPILDGNTSNTYLNWTMDYEGPYPTPALDCLLLIDEYPFGWITSFADGDFPAFWVAINNGPNTIAGGRHTLINSVDHFDDCPESNEFDNVWMGQWVWSPLELQKEAAVLRDPPPDRGMMTYPNSDGMSFARPPSFAWVTGIAPHDPADDYDLIVYDDYSGSTSGFSNDIGYSNYGGNSVDFVVGHFSGTPLVVYPAAIRYDMGTGNLFSADQSDALSRQGGWNAYFANQVLDPNRLVDVYEANLSAGVTYYFTLHRQSGASDIAFEIFPASTGGVYGRGQSAGGASLVMDANTDTLAFTAAVDGYHPIVVHRDNGTGVTQDGILYTFIWNTNPVVDVPKDRVSSHKLTFYGATPNPMVGSGRIQFTLAERGVVRLSVFDLRGRRVARLVDEALESGPHSVIWNGSADAGGRLGPGIYWLRLEARNRVLIQRVVLLN